jgi:hypothetical protein
MPETSESGWTVQFTCATQLTVEHSTGFPNVQGETARNEAVHLGRVFATQPQTLILWANHRRRIMRCMKERPYYIQTSLIDSRTIPVSLTQSYLPSSEAPPFPPPPPLSKPAHAHSSPPTQHSYTQYQRRMA